MISHWEEFQAGPSVPLGQRVHVTLNPKNVILLGVNVWNKMGKPTSAVLLFDKVNSVIGIRPDRVGRAIAFPIREMPGTGIRHEIVATRFCQHYGIRVDRTTAFVDPEIDEDGILRLDLKRTFGINRRSRKKRAEVS